MPVEKYSQIKRFTEKIKVTLPPAFKRRLETHYEDEIYIQRTCIEHILSICRRLISEAVPGIHFFILNRADRATRILQHLPR